jgi:hypothetical protein
MIFVPTYRHDCEVCRLLGSAIDDHHVWDWYFCERDQCMVGRRSDEQSNYLWYPIFMLDSDEFHFGVHGKDSNPVLITHLVIAAFFYHRDLARRAA